MDDSELPPIETDRRLRKVHYTLAVLHVIAFLVLLGLLYIRATQLAFFLIVTEGTVGLIAGIYIAILASNLEFGGGAAFRIGRKGAGLLTWTPVAAIVLNVINYWCVIHLLAGSESDSSAAAQALSERAAACATDAAPVACFRVTIESVQPLLVSSMKHDHTGALVLVALVLGVIFILELVTIAYNAMIVHAYAKWERRFKHNDSGPPSPRRIVHPAPMGVIHDAMPFSVPAPAPPHAARGASPTRPPSGPPRGGGIVSFQARAAGRR
jgi:hypothetical protein